MNKLVNFIYSLFSINYARVILDISKWQCTYDDSKLFDFNVYEESDGIMIIVKASQGKYADKRYSYYINEIIPREIMFCTYHFGDTNYNARESARFWAEQINSLPEDKYKSSKEITRHWLDVENAGFRNTSKIYNRQWIRDFLSEMKKLTDVKIGIYTSYFGWNDNIAFMLEIHELDLWQADYDSEPTPPENWSDYGKTWMIWQKCANCTSCGGCGIDYGAASISIDINWFNGTIDDFNNWITGDEGMSSQEYEELLSLIDINETNIGKNTERIIDLEGGTVEPPEFYKEMRCIANPSLRLRDAPETGSTLVGIPYDAIVLVSDERVSDSRGRGYWVYTKYLQYVGWTAEWYLEEINYIKITAVEDLRVETIQGHDSACPNERGKPSIFPDPRKNIKYLKDEVIRVEKDGIKYSCKDDKDTNTVKASGGVFYYRIAEGKGKDLQFNNYPKGGYINKDKVREGE